MSDATWVKDPQIFEGGTSGGDWQVSDDVNVRYRLTAEPDDGLFAMVDENFYVESRADDYQSPPYVVVCQAQYHVCTDPENPGGTETYSDYEYDDSVAPNAEYDNLDDAIKAARKLAEDAEPSWIIWDGRRIG
jgi:hypothetical protein